MITLEQMNDEREIRELADVFANLADVKDAKGQGELFLPDGVLEFQRGTEGAIQNIVGREALVKAFAATINPCKAVYHMNGQHVIRLHGEEATGTAYCVATLVNEKDSKYMVTVNDVRYTDLYQKSEGKWYLKKRRTIFLLSETHELMGSSPE